MSDKVLVTTYEAVDASKEDPFMQMIVFKKTMEFLERELRIRFEDSNYEPAKYIEFMESAVDLGFKHLAEDIKAHIKKYSMGDWKIYIEGKKSDHSGASDQDNR